MPGTGPGTQRTLDQYQLLDNLKKRIEAKLQSILGLRTKVTLVAPKTLERFQGKAKRIVDLRNTQQ